MFFKAHKIFTCFGFTVKADAGWLFVSILLAWTFANTTFPQMFAGYSADTYQMMGVLTLFGIILSIIVHEVAHAVIAEYYHMPINSITLFIFGGVAEMKGEPSHPKGELLMALSGPAMTFFMAIFFYASQNVWVENVAQGPLSNVLGYLGLLNVYLGFYNLIPAMPLDGGRALRAILWHKKKNFVLATRIATNIGQYFAYALISYGIYQIVMENNMVGGMWSAIFGLISQAANNHTLERSENMSLLAHEKVARFINANIISVPPHLTIAQVVDQFVTPHYQRIFPVVEKGSLIGVITLKSILSLDRNKWQWLHVESIMESLSEKNTAQPSCDSASLFDQMQKNRTEIMMVVEDKKLLGTVSYTDLATFLSVSIKIDYNKPVTFSRKV